MIGNPDWFQIRKYGGWGITPRTWQGWIYIAVLILPFVVFQAFPFWGENLRITVTVIWMSIILIDILYIMAKMKKDEREYKVEATAERNAAWSMVIVLATGLLVDFIRSGMRQDFTVNPFLLGALVVGAVSKSISNLILRNKNL